MRAIRSGFLAAAACSAAILLTGCGDSNDVTSPGPMVTGVDVAGTWSGDFQSDSPALCSGSAASAILTQEGTSVKGPFKALGCGINGMFRGSVSGNHLTGTVEMIGCTGGAVSGTMTEAGLRITVGDFKKQLVTGGPGRLPRGDRHLPALTDSPAPSAARLSSGSWRRTEDASR